MSEDECEQLLEEYQLLRRRLEEIDFSGPDQDGQDDPGVNKEDVERLQDLKDRLETECDVEMPTDADTDLDLPEYAAGPPSEPHSFSGADDES